MTTALPTPDLIESAYLITARHPASGRILAHAQRSGLCVDDTWIGWAVQGADSWEIVDNITAARALVVELASKQLAEVSA